jgi:hypothetical protein
MVRYAVMVIAEKTDIKEIEFNKGRIIITLWDGTRAEYNYCFLKRNGGINFGN